MKNDTIYILFILFLMGLPIVSLGLYTILGLRAEEIKSERLNTKGVEYSLAKQMLKNIAEEKKLKDTQENK
ncbi:hypothetical protein [Aliarcobacter butzleri]|uniref:hypothetical protein n=1 Tax=Aliarcobacter butzleri TaxID=28197 RepID=UPI00126099FC|nr:hypothetical protein [Aliarcobacter butzleri]